jgi:uncharacterized membrane protein
MFIGLFFVIGVIAFVVYNSGWRPQGQNDLFPTAAKSLSALDIAKNRYASGEISKEEFEQIRFDLTQ